MKFFLFISCFLFIVTSLFSCREKAPLFRLLPEEQTGIHFRNHVKETDSLNILTYPYLFNGGGVAIADFNRDGKEDIFFAGNEKGSNKLYLNRGNFRFEDVTASAGVAGISDWSTGVSTADINGDGWMDVYVSTVTIPGLLHSTNELYINNKNGTFTEAAALYGLNLSAHTTQTLFFDLDNDGDLDCYLLNHPVSYADDYKTIAQRNFRDSMSGDKLLRNDGNYFTDITVGSGIYSSNIGFGLGIAAGDINNDGWTDIYVSNDFKENDYCYINNGNGTFREATNSMFTHTSRFSMGNDMADYNNDGWTDIITLDMLPGDEKILKSSVADDDIETYDYKQHFGFQYQYSKNCLQQNIDGKYFSDKGLQAGVAATDWSWAPLLADFNNDGYKDLFISNGFKYRVNDLDFNSFVQNTLVKNQRSNITTNRRALISHIPNGAVPDYFFLNDGNFFINASEEASFTMPTLSNGAAYADLDGDGDLDLVVNRMDATAGIYQNNSSPKNHLEIALHGDSLNTNGIGAKLFVYTRGKMQFFQQFPVRGFLSAVSPKLHIGLGDEELIDSLFITWASGKTQRLTNVRANQTLTLQEANATTRFSSPAIQTSLDTNWQQQTAASGISFLHKEDEFDDLAVQPLLPHSLATQGPAMATADINGDGLQDVFVGGARNEAGAVYCQTKNGAFIQMQERSLEEDSAFEDIQAIFFDANGDARPDLYVTSGGNEWYGRNKWLNDRLYLNDGAGHFSRSETLPMLNENKSCVAACDWDKDGDTDLFVGGRANARMYGYLPASVILQNDGDAHFTEVTNLVAPGLQHIGMVTSAVWSDIDNDGWKDLIIAGEWMPLTVFKNNQGKLEREYRSELEKTNGWWNCIYADDIDGDGDTDFLLGNWGTNTKLKASAEKPLLLYLADWDNNGETEPVLSRFNNNDYYNFLNKSDLEKRLPFIKKKFLKYGDAAGKTTEEIFGKHAVNNARKMAAFTLQSSVVWNNNGKLQLQPLPSFLQNAPIFSFCSYKEKNGSKHYAAGGNFFEVSPFEGRYDAMLPTLFQFQNGKAELSGLLPCRSCVRQIRNVQNSAGENRLLLAANNDSVIVFIKK